MPDDVRICEQRVRRLAKSLGMELEKPRDGGPYLIHNVDGKTLRFKGFTIAQVEVWLNKLAAENGGRRTKWESILSEAKAIVESYDTGVTLRQLFYQLVSRQLIRNLLTDYNYLSRVTARARREGWFPALIDPTSRILEPKTFSSPQAAMAALRRSYRRDRTEGQDVSIYLGVEKAGIEQQLRSWFWDLGVPILALGGYASQTFAADIAADVEAKGRPAVLIYAGDHDASGDDLYRDLLERTDCWAKTRRIALTREQVEEYELPRLEGKIADPRVEAFMQTHGYDTPVQVEMDALDPTVLRGLYQDAVDEFWDDEAYAAVMESEEDDRDALE